MKSCVPKGRVPFLRRRATKIGTVPVVVAERHENGTIAPGVAVSDRLLIADGARGFKVCFWPVAGFCRRRMEGGGSEWGRQPFAGSTAWVQ
jgi:hypothetical protein